MAKRHPLIYLNEEGSVVTENVIFEYPTVLFEGNDIKVRTTGHDYDFVATISNFNNRKCTIVFDDEDIENIEIAGNDWVGLMAIGCDMFKLESLTNGKCHIVFDGEDISTVEDGCSYCKESKSLFWCDDYNEHAIRKVYIEQDGSITVNTNIDDNEANLESQRWGLPATARDTCSFPIKFCPMCGRPLHKEDGENND